MTGSPELEDAAGTPAIGEPSCAATIAAPSTALRRFFRPASRARQPTATANDLAFGIRKSPPIKLLDPDDERSRKASAVAPPGTCGGHVVQRGSVNTASQ